MVEATPKALAIAAMLFVVGAMFSGYLFSIGADLWELTKQSLSLTLPNATTLFWIVSVPLGVVGIILALLAVLHTGQRSKVLERPEELVRKYLSEFVFLSSNDHRRKAIWEAIKEWVEPPSNKLPSQQDPLPLAGKPPKLAAEIEECLSRNYPSIWADVEELKRKHAELMAIKDGKIPDEFWEGRANEVPTLRLDLVLAREASLRAQLAEMQRQLIQRINSEILERHYTRLKC